MAMPHGVVNNLKTLIDLLCLFIPICSGYALIVSNRFKTKFTIKGSNRQNLSNKRSFGFDETPIRSHSDELRNNSSPRWFLLIPFSVNPTFTVNKILPGTTSGIDVSLALNQAISPNHKLQDNTAGRVSIITDKNFMRRPGDGLHAPQSVPSGCGIVLSDNKSQDKRRLIYDKGSTIPSQ